MIKERIFTLVTELLCGKQALSDSVLGPSIYFLTWGFDRIYTKKLSWERMACKAVWSPPHIPCVQWGHSADHCTLTSLTTGLSTLISGLHYSFLYCLPVGVFPDSKVYGSKMGPTLGQQDPDGPHVGPMNLAIWVVIDMRKVCWKLLLNSRINQYQGPYTVLLGELSTSGMN